MANLQRHRHMGQHAGKTLPGQHPEGYGVRFTVLSDKACNALDALLRGLGSLF